MLSWIFYFISLYFHWCQRIVCCECHQECYVENLDNGKLFDILYYDETQILKLDLIKDVADGRRIYPLGDFYLFVMTCRWTLCVVYGAAWHVQLSHVLYAIVAIREAVEAPKSWTRGEGKSSRRKKLSYKTWDVSGIDRATFLYFIVISLSFNFISLAPIFVIGVDSWFVQLL